MLSLSRDWCLRLMLLICLLLPAACADQTKPLAVLGGAGREMSIDENEDDDAGFSAPILPAMPEGRMQCVPFARAVSGVNLRGNAGTWWRSAQGKYLRGQEPQPMAVMVLKPSGRMRLGHVAVVTKILSPREVLVSHANWGWDRASRGRVRHGQRAVDVSANNDWTSIRFYNVEFGTLGRPYPAFGFIYGNRRREEDAIRLAVAEPPMRPIAAPVEAVSADALDPEDGAEDDDSTMDAAEDDAANGTDEPDDAADADDPGSRIALADADALESLSYPPPPQAVKRLVSLVAEDSRAPPLPPPSPRRKAVGAQKPDRGDHVPPPPQRAPEMPAVLERRRVIP